MNAAFLLVTSACLTGQLATPVAPPAAATPAPVISTVSPGGCSSCGSTYDGCCDTAKHGLFSRFSGIFGRGHGSSCDSCSSCGTSYTHSWPTTTSSCGTSSCGTTSSCDSCGGHAFLSRFRGMFGRGHASSCCDTGTTSGCSSCAPSTSVGTTVPTTIPGAPAPIGGGGSTGEVIPTPPKKMPTPPKATTPPAKTSITPTTPGITIAPAPAPAIAPAPTTAPIIEVVPPAVPAVPGSTTQPRSPF